MKWLAGALLFTGACMGAPGEPPAAVVAEATGGCDATPAQVLIGQAPGKDTGARALQLSGAQVLRWIRPGDMVTMDYRTDRMNIELDESGRVRAVRCG